MSESPIIPAPYRDAPQIARYLCVACFAWAAPVPGACGHCRLPLADIRKPEVLQAMHEEANRRLRRRQKREYFYVTFLGMTIFLGLNAVGLGWAIPFIAGTLIAFLALSAYVRLFPGRSAIATLDARAIREKALNKPDDQVPKLTTAASDDSDDVPDPAMARFAGPDPDLLDADELIKWFGARLHI